MMTVFPYFSDNVTVTLHICGDRHISIWPWVSDYKPVTHTTDKKGSLGVRIHTLCTNAQG